MQMKIVPEYFLFMKEIIKVVVMMGPTKVVTLGYGGNLHGGALTLKVHTPLKNIEIAIRESG